MMTYLHKMNGHNEINYILFESYDSGAAKTVGREGKSVDVYGSLMFPVKGIQEVRKVNFGQREKQAQRL